MYKKNIKSGYYVVCKHNQIKFKNRHWEIEQQH